MIRNSFERHFHPSIAIRSIDFRTETTRRNGSDDYGLYHNPRKRLLQSIHFCSIAGYRRHVEGFCIFSIAVYCGASRPALETLDFSFSLGDDPGRSPCSLCIFGPDSPGKPILGYWITLLGVLKGRSPSSLSILPGSATRLPADLSPSTSLVNSCGFPK